MSLLANSNAIEDAGYKIQRSLRFRSSASAYLSRTPASAGNQKTWTWSSWIKRGKVNVNEEFMVFATPTSANFQVYFGNTGGSYADKLLIGSDAAGYYRISNAVFRDPSAWYHLVIVLDTTNATATNRLRAWINGVELTWSVNNTITQNADLNWNNTAAHRIGARNPDLYFDGYMAEVNFIDGQALTPSSFGQTDPVTGVWTPKKYTGTYGTNGFYLPFTDNSSPTTLGYDKSGNGNNWTPNNISTTAGATYDSMTDVPTLTSASAANYCVLNPLNTNGNVTVSAGNLDVVGTSTTDTSVGSTFAVSSGKWYCEATFTVGASHDFIGVGITTPQNSLSQGPGYYSDGYMVGFGTNNSTFYKVNNNSYVDASLNYSGAGTYVVQIALDMDNGKVWFGRNNTWISSGDPAAGTNATYSSISSSNPQMVKWWGDSSGPASMNFGQRPFSYTPPTGFKALNTFNLPDPVIKKPNQYMDATTYTGNGTSISVTNSGSMQPDFVWIKDRTTAYNHILIDSVRGGTKVLRSSSTDAESTETNGISSFNSNGYTVGTLASANSNGDAYVAWQWKKGATPGFDIVTYTGNGVAGRTVSHSLGVAPKMMIVKQRNGAENWQSYHASLGATQRIFLNLTDAASSTAAAWNNTEPTSSVFTLGTSNAGNGNTNTYVAYLFAEIAGFSKFGSYTGNGADDGVFVFTGFRPTWLMVKRTNTSGTEWFIYDSKRNAYNLTQNPLRANTADAESANATLAFDMLSNGFKARTSGSAINGNGNTYIYAAFAENPFKYSLAR